MIYFMVIFKELIIKFVSKCLMILTFSEKIIKNLHTCLLHGNFNTKIFCYHNKVD